MHQDRTRERRFRRLVQKRGCALKKNRTRDPGRPGDGGYMIVDRTSKEPVMGHMPFPFSMNLDQVEGWLSRHEKVHWCDRRQRPSAEVES
jgi:hypothetical protein